MKDLRTAAALFVLTFVPYVYFYGGWGANQEVNYALTRAMFEARTFAVDQFTVHEGDISSGAGGHIYINKPPGLSALAYPPYVVQFKMQQRGWMTFREYWQTNKQLVTIQVCGIGGALIAPILYLYGRRKLGISRWSAAVAAIAVAFGTIVFPYSTMFFAHVPSALFLLLAFVLLKDRPLIAGAAAGVAGACFFLSALAALVLLMLAWWYSRRHALLFVLGGVPFAAALAVYQWICFGSPFTTPVERSISFTDQSLFLGVFGKPRLAPLGAITFSEYRGLFFCSPILLFAFAGAAVMLRQRRFRAELAAIAGITVFFFVSVSSFNGWHGGAAFGPRYLLPVVPLMGIPMMFVADRARWLWLAVGIVSVAINLAATSVDAMPLPEEPRPLTGYILRARGVAIPPDARNLGEPLFGAHHPASVLPAVAWIIGGSWLLLAAVSRDLASPRSTRRPRARP